MARARLAAVGTALGVAASVSAQVAYEVLPGGTMTRYLCLPPCACPPIQITGGLRGTFTLAYDHEDESFQYYNVLGAAWVADLNGVPTPIFGSGTYKLRLPVRWLHQLELDLQVGQEPVRRFDSGLVAVGIHNQFPRIQVVATTEQFGCERQEFDIIAAPAVCYANCDGSSIAPVLNINDFICFQQEFAAGEAYANCDGSTTAPVLNINDFICFQQKFAAGCP